MSTLAPANAVHNSGIAAAGSKAARRSGAFARSLTMGFAGAVAMWVIAYVAMMGPGLVLGEALFAVTLACASIAGYLASTARNEGEVAWLAGAKVGVVIAAVNMLLIGSLVGNESQDRRIIELLWWTLGNFTITIALAAIGGLAAGIWPLRKIGDRDWFAWFTRVVAVSVFLLLITGGLVTGLEAGLAVPDWPNSFGHNMLLYPLSEMKGGIYYEHAHRLYGMLVGVSAITLALSSLYFDSRMWLRVLAFGFLAMVSVQGYLGGTRVTETSIPLAIMHGVFGQLVFAIACIIAVVTAPQWKPARVPTDTAAAGTDRRWSSLVVVALVLQLALGAVYRHTLHVHVLYTHILWAALVTGAVVFVAGRAWRGHPAAASSDRSTLERFGKSLLHATLLQLALGVIAMIAVWSRDSKPPTSLGEATPLEVIPVWETAFTSAHQATGALILALATMLMLWTRRMLPSRAQS